MADDNELLARISEQLERLLVVMEKKNHLEEMKARCQACLGSGKAYGGARCIRCGGVGVGVLPK